MFILVFSCCSVLALDNLPKGLKMKSQYFCILVPDEIRGPVIGITKNCGIERGVIHMDNGKFHNYARSMKRLEKFQVTPLPRPPYSSDVSPVDI
jgi:hypothetical protein